MNVVLLTFVVSVIHEFVQYYQLTIDQRDVTKLLNRLPKDVFDSVVSPISGNRRLPPPSHRKSLKLTSEESALVAASTAIDAAASQDKPQHAASAASPIRPVIPVDASPESEERWISLTHSSRDVTPIIRPIRRVSRGATVAVSSPTQHALEYLANEKHGTSSTEHENKDIPRFVLDPSSETFPSTQQQSSELDMADRQHQTRNDHTRTGRDENSVDPAIVDLKRVSNISPSEVVSQNRDERS